MNIVNYQLMVRFLAISEAKNPCDVDFVHKMKWETMTFNVFEMGTEDSVQRAFDVLRDGGVVIEAIHELPWSKCCGTVWCGKVGYADNNTDEPNVEKIMEDFRSVSTLPNSREDMVFINPKRVYMSIVICMFL